MSLIRASKINLIIDGVSIIDNVDLTINQGQFINIIGPNGAGKSSLLKIIIGLITPSSGKVNIAPGTKIGYMPQKLHINSMMPILVRNFLDIDNGSTSINHIVDSIGLGRLLDKSIHSLSKGETQRVLLARALLYQPNLLILDEPEQGLDIEGRMQFYKLLETIKKDNNIAVLMVSHDLNFVHKSSDFVVCLNKHVCCSGTPNIVYNSEEYKELFHAVIAPYVHHHDHAHD